MMTYDASNAQCWVYSFKEGLLSKIAHDLKHRVTRFSIRVDDAARQVEAEIDARSLRVECVMKDGKELTSELTGDDKEEIEGQIIADVLNADEHPMIRFRSRAVTECAEGLRIEGEITLNDCSRPVATLARRVRDQYVADLTIHQPSFGIKPFSAMLGALKIKPDVLVRLVVPAN
jgi:polyisoprenoid-binding protein YceI